MEGSEGNDHQQVEQRKGHMHEASDREQRHRTPPKRHLLPCPIGAFFGEAQKIVAECSGEGREGAVGRGIARRHHTQHEHHAGEAAEAEGNGGEYLVGLVGEDKACGLCIDDKRRPEAEEYDVDDDEEKAGGHHILLRVAETLAGEVLLHHILVKARHGDGDEHTGEHLLQPELGRHRICVEHTGVALVGRDGEKLRDAHIQPVEDSHHRCHGGKNQEGCLQHIRPHHRLDAAGEGVEQDDGYEHYCRYPEGDAP